MAKRSRRSSPADSPYMGVTEPMAPALMRANHERALKRIIEHLHAAGFREVRASHAPLIDFPGPHKRRPGELAERTGRSKQHINILLGELEAAGYLERRPADDDQRGKIIYLTKRGMALAAAITDAVEEVEAEWRRAIGERRFAALKRDLRELQEAAGSSGRVQAPNGKPSSSGAPQSPK